MVITDHFSGFTWTSTCEDKVQDNLVKFMAKLLLEGGYGPLTMVLTDCGTEMSNTLTESIDSQQ
jgi:hypothetical protein